MRMVYALRYTSVLCLMAVGWFSIGEQAEAQRKNPRVEEMTAARRPDRIIIRSVADIMANQHLSQHPLDDEISERAFDSFLRSLDPLKQYFLAEDVSSFKANKKEIDDFVRDGKMDFAIQVFKTFLVRLDQRMEMVHKQIDAEHDFTLDEKLTLERDLLEYPADDAAAMDRIRKQVKYQLLVLEVNKLQAEKDKKAGKEMNESERILAGDPNEDPKERLHRRYRTLQKRWHQTDADELLEIFVSSLTTSFDPHTSYMSPDTLENFRIALSLNLDGIGAQLTSEDGYTKLTSIVPGGAADKDGRLKPGDRIIAVGQGEDGPLADVVDMKLDDVVAQIRGTAGTVVRLSVISSGGGEAKTINITRAKIKLEDSAARSEIVEYGKKPDGEPFKVGYIDLPSFYMDMEAAQNNDKDYRSTTRDCRRILAEFRENDIDAVVLDLSRNGGGSLPEAINLTGLFIDRGPVVQVKDPSGQVQVYDDDNPGVAWDGPLVVMTSKESASASEILAGAIQDYGRGLIIGDKQTHGKGTVQTLADLGRLLGLRNMGALKLTIQQFYLPDGASTQRIGVMSDVILPKITAEFDNSEADLDYALPADNVPKTNHIEYGMVDSTILSKLRTASSARVASSKGFERLLKRMEIYREQKDEDYISLNRDQFIARREEMDANAEEQEQALESAMPKKDVFKLDYYNTEVLNIAKEYAELIDQMDIAQAG